MTAKTTPAMRSLPSSRLSCFSLALALAAALAAPRHADAHPLDLGYLRIDAEPSALAAGLDLDVGAVAHLLDLDADALAAGDRATLARHAGALAAATLRRGPLVSDLGECRWLDEASASLANRTVSISQRAECPGGARSLRWPMPFITDPRISATFQLLVKGRTPAGQQLATLDRNHTELTLALGGDATSSSFTAFLWSGVEHIGAAPDQWYDAGGWKLADGIDHILFLLALLLAGGTILQLAGIATGFTLGHSITLALSALGVMRPPGAVIEPLIALSIALVAAEAYLARPGNHRWKIATGFGLVHGFGFAGALNELGLSPADSVKALFGYNFGVELGQLAIVLVVAPAILLLQRRPGAHRLVVRVSSAAIFVAGMYWCVQRIIDSI